MNFLDSIKAKTAVAKTEAESAAEAKRTADQQAEEAERQAAAQKEATAQQAAGLRERVRNALRVSHEDSIMLAAKYKSDLGDMVAKNKEAVAGSLGEVNSALEEAATAAAAAKAAGVEVVEVTADEAQGAKIEAIKGSTVEGLKAKRDEMRETLNKAKTTENLGADYDNVSDEEVAKLDTALESGDHETLKGVQGEISKRKDAERQAADREAKVSEQRAEAEAGKKAVSEFYSTLNSEKAALSLEVAELTKGSPTEEQLDARINSSPEVARVQQNIDQFTEELKTLNNGSLNKEAVDAKKQQIKNEQNFMARLQNSLYHEFKQQHNNALSLETQNKIARLNAISIVGNKESRLTQHTQDNEGTSAQSLQKGEITAQEYLALQREEIAAYEQGSLEELKRPPGSNPELDAVRSAIVAEAAEGTKNAAAALEQKKKDENAAAVKEIHGLIAQDKETISAKMGEFRQIADAFKAEERAKYADIQRLGQEFVDKVKKEKGAFFGGKQKAIATMREGLPSIKKLIENLKEKKTPSEDRYHKFRVGPTNMEKIVELTNSVKLDRTNPANEAIYKSIDDEQSALTSERRAVFDSVQANSVAARDAAASVLGQLETIFQELGMDPKEFES